MFKFYYSLIFIAIFVNCQKKEKRDDFTKFSIKKEYRFKAGANAQGYHKELYFDKKTQTEFVYFYNFVTSKEVKFFDLQGNLKQVTPVKLASEAIGKLRYIQVVSLDTLILCSEYTSNLAIINGKGEVKHKLFLDSLLTDSKGNHFELWQFKILDAEKGTIIHACDWVYNTQDIAQKKEPKEKIENNMYRMKNMQKSAYFCKIYNLYEGVPRVEYGLPEFYSNIGKEDDYFPELPHYNYVNGKIFVYSTYSDSLYQVNPVKMNIEKKIPIRSDFTPAYTKHFKNDKETWSKPFLTDQISKIGSYIYSIEYDKIKERYYIIVYHRISATTPPEQQGYDKRPFSLIVYDKNFKKMYEKVFNNKEHNAYYMLVSQEGAMFHRKNIYLPKDKKSNETTTFTLFDFE